MSNRNRNGRNGKGFFGDHYWQSADYNRREVLMYQQMLRSIAMTRFKWEGLPEGCDERYLEQMLFYQGSATIAHPKDMDLWVSTQVSMDGVINIYDNPTSWKSIGNNGWNFDVGPENGVIVWENRQRLPILSQIDLYARRLAHVDRIIDINLEQQLTPFIITGDKTQHADMINAFKQIAGGEPAIIATNSFTDSIKIDALNTNVEFIGDQLQLMKANILDEAYTLMGIGTVKSKAERMIVGELAGQTEPAQLLGMDPLNARRDAANILNERFGLNVEVYWRKDNESDNYNFENNLQLQATLGKQEQQSGESTKEGEE